MGGAVSGRKLALVVDGVPCQMTGLYIPRCSAPGGYTYVRRGTHAVPEKGGPKDFRPGQIAQDVKFK